MNRITRGLVLAMLIAPAAAYAQGDAPAKTAVMNCPMMGQMTAMQKDMSGLMGDMDAMLQGVSDPAAKARMQMVREHMTAMMANIRMMGGMMGGAVAPQSGNDISRAPSATTPAAPEGHDTHHSDK